MHLLIFLIKVNKKRRFVNLLFAFQASFELVPGSRGELLTAVVAALTTTLAVVSVGK